MATEPTKTVGKIDCICCGQLIPVRQNGRDTLNISCPWCGLSAYAKGGTESHRTINGWLRKDAAPEAAPAAPAAPGAPGAGPLVAVKNAFNLGAV